jgi:hypothetical protein
MISDSNLFCYCNFPQPPAEIVDLIVKSAIDGVTEGKNTQFLTRSSITPNQQKDFAMHSHFVLNGAVHKRAIYRRYDTDSIVSSWVKKNITPTFGQIGSQLVYGGETFCPHTDGGPREYILNYTIETGGDNVETQWFVEPGHNIVREGISIQFPDPSKLKLIKSVTFPKGSWTLLYGKVIHSVTGVIDKRLQLSIALSKEEFNGLKEQHNLDLKYYG